MDRFGRTRRNATEAVEKGIEAGYNLAIIRSDIQGFCEDLNRDRKSHFWSRLPKDVAAYQVASRQEEAHIIWGHYSSSETVKNYVIQIDSYCSQIKRKLGLLELPKTESRISAAAKW